MDTPKVLAEPAIDARLVCSCEAIPRPNWALTRASVAQIVRCKETRAYV